MNFPKTYQNLNVPIAPSAALVEKTLRKTRRKPLPICRLAAVAAAVAVLLTVPAIAVQTSAGYALFYAAAPAAAQFFQPVRLRSEDSGVIMEVQAVQVEGSTAKAYISLTGEQVDGTCDLFDSYRFHLPFDQSCHCERVGYDAAAKTALFLCTVETLDGSDIPLRSKMTFSVDCFLSGKETAEDLAVPLRLADFTAEMETVSAGGPEDAYWRTGGSGSGDGGRARMDEAPMLKPGAILAEPLAGLSITAAGYAEGLYYVQLCRGDATRLDNHGRLWLEDGDGNRLKSVFSAGFASAAQGSARVDYDQFAFDVSPEILAGCTLHGDFVAASSLTEGRWQVTFPLENTGSETMNAG